MVRLPHGSTPLTMTLGFVIPSKVEGLTMTMKYVIPSEVEGWGEKETTKVYPKGGNL